MLVVPPYEANEAELSLLAVLEDVQVEALAEHGPDPALRLAVGLRVVGPRASMADSSCSAHAPPNARAVRVAGVGEHALRHDPLSARPADGANQEPRRGATAPAVAAPPV